MRLTLLHARRAAVGAVLALTVAACAPPTAPASTPAPAKPGAATPNPTAVAEGLALVQLKTCGACHIIPGVPGASGAVGPNLTGVASRPTLAGGVVPHGGPDDMKRWLLDPPAAKPGTQMPKLGLSDDEATRITAFLETLR